MKSPAIPSDEAERHAALCALEVLDTRPEARFDRLTRIAQSHFQVPIALVSMIDTNRQWFKSRQGLDATETPRDVSFCGHAILSEGIFHIPDAHADPRFADNPLVTGPPHVRFYAGAPLHAPGGQRVGTLCVIDSRPRQFSAEDLAVLRDLADAVEAELEHIQLRTVQMQMRSAENRLRAVIDTVADGIVSIDRSGVVQTFNPAAERIFGYAAAEVIGHNVSMLMPEPYQSGHDGYLDNYLRTGTRKVIGIGREVIGRRKNGGTFPMELAVSEMDVGGERMFTGIVRDVTKRKAMELASKRYEAIVQSSDDAIMGKTLDGFITSWNLGAEKLFGYRAAEVIGRPMLILFPPGLQAEEQEILKKIARGEKVEPFDTVRRRKDGSQVEISASISPIVDEESKIVGVSNIARDISDRKRLDRLKSEFVSTVSHELRTPLTSIRGALSLLAGKHGAALTDKGRQLLDMAKRNSERLTLLINDILDLEKIESGNLEFDFKSLDLAALAQQALAANEGYAHQHGVHLRLAEAPRGAAIRGDEHRLLQVFANLLSNAVKYSPKDGEVVVSVSRRDSRYRVSVQDRGRGIPAEFRSRMFQRFAQADSSDTREKGGTGLGLSVTKAIVERHGGAIDYLSESGIGTEFFFELPVLDDTGSKTRSQERRPLVLICEDNPDVAHLLSEMLTGVGMACEIAATAARAKSLLARERYRALVLDLGLPDQDGLELIAELRAREDTRDLPIIVVSGRAGDDKAAWRGDALAVIDWLQKPVDEARLAQAVQQALTGRLRPRILHVEDDLDIVQVVQAMVEGMAEYSYATDIAAARRRLADGEFDLVLLDLVLPDGSGLELLEELKGRTPVIIFSGREPGGLPSAQVAAALVKTKTSNEQLLETIKQTIYRKRSARHE